MHLEPVLMLPAYRFGKETPWGGDKLRRLYFKYAQAERVGCSLEVSTLPDYQSTSPDGRTLTDLIKEYGVDLLGTKLNGAFPFLIQLIDACGDLDIHVHPAKKYTPEDGSVSDSSEGLVILHADKNARVIYGLEKDESIESLEQKIASGENVTHLFQEIPIHPGEAFSIPGGVPHAIGHGVLLYAINSSGTPAFRLCKRKQPESHGRIRPLETEKALHEMKQCSYTSHHLLSPNNEQADPLCSPIISTQCFTVKRIRHAQALRFSENAQRFSVLTCLFPAEIKLESGKMLYLASGQTLLIPAMTCPFTLTCAQALLAEPEV